MMPVVGYAWQEARQVDVGDGVKPYRALDIGDRWPRSYFQYWNEKRLEWRNVRNWSFRERLFTEWLNVCDPF